MPVILHRLAVQDFVTARRWYGRRSRQAEARFAAAVGDALRGIEANPLLDPVFTGSHRWRRVRRFPYVIYYEPISTGTVFVYAIAHAGQRPGFWLRRVTRP